MSTVVSGFDYYLEAAAAAWRVAVVRIQKSVEILSATFDHVLNPNVVARGTAYPCFRRKELC